MSVIAEPQVASAQTAEFGSALPPGYDTFLSNYQQVQALSTEAKANLVMHDLGSSITTPITGIVTYYNTLMNGMLYNKTLPANSSVAERLDYVEGALKLDFSGLKSSSADFDAYAQDIVRRKVEPLQRCFPLMKASAMFLEAPTPVALSSLNAVEVSLRDLGALYDIPSEHIPDMKLNGARAVIALNLLSNAARHTSDVKAVSVEAHPDGFSVNNPSTEPLPSTDIFALGIKGGDSKGFGYGLFMSKHLYGPLIGADITATSQNTPGKEAPYQIQFRVANNTK